MKIGELYTLIKSPGIAAYAMWEYVDRKNPTDWVSVNELEEPFLLLEETSSDTNYWIRILLINKIGWIHIEKEQLKLFDR